MIKRDYLPSSIKNSSVKMLKELRVINYAKLEKAAKMFVRQSALRLKAGEWLDGVEPTKEFLEGHVGNFKILTEADAESLFTPYVEKYSFDPGSEIAVIGDVHGDLEGLVAILEHFRLKGYLNSDYLIERQNFYIVFIGDYTNRSKHSVEVMMLLFLLHRQNVGSMFLLRGNHEYAICNKDLYEKYIAQGLDERETLLGELAQKLEVYYYPDFLYWYDYLPLALYFGCTDSTGTTNFIQLSHAGIEMGFNPQVFLKNDAIRFQKITKLNRHEELEKLLHNKEFSLLHGQIRKVFDYLADHEKSADLAATYLEKDPVELTHQHSPLFLRLGLQWNSFLSEDHDVGISVSLKQRNIYLGQELTRHFLAQSGGDKEKLVSIIRGHQHYNDYDEAVELHADMLDKIIANNGLLKQWDGMVYTLGDLGYKTGYQSFVVLTMAEQQADWKMQHFFKKPGQEVFQESSFSMFE